MFTECTKRPVNVFCNANWVVGPLTKLLLTAFLPTIFPVLVKANIRKTKTLRKPGSRENALGVISGSPSNNELRRPEFQNSK